MDNFPDSVDTAESPVGAGNTQKQVRGRPITKETAKAMQMSSTRAKKARKEARLKMLSALTDKLDLGDELYKAMSQRDADYLKMIIDATRLVGLQHDQSQEALAQRLEVKADANVTKDSTVKLVIEDFTVPQEG